MLACSRPVAELSINPKLWWGRLVVVPREIADSIDTRLGKCLIDGTTRSPRTSIVEPSVLEYSRIVEATRHKITGFLFILGAVFFQKNSAKLQENHHAWMNLFQIYGGRYKLRKTR
jgi:hypothetical protein